MSLRRAESGYSEQDVHFYFRRLSASSRPIPSISNTHQFHPLQLTHQFHLSINNLRSHERFPHQSWYKITYPSPPTTVRVPSPSNKSCLHKPANFFLRLLPKMNPDEQTTETIPEKVHVQLMIVPTQPSPTPPLPLPLSYANAHARARI